MATEETVEQIDDYKGYKMITIGNTRMSLNKALKVIAHAEAINQIAARVEAQPQVVANPFTV